jgi:hypothetical protein
MVPFGATRMLTGNFRSDLRLRACQCPHVPEPAGSAAFTINKYSQSHIYGMLEIMKTTVEISDDLLRQAKEYAARHGIPMREVIERGLQLVLQAKKPSRRPFRLKTVTTKGEGLVCDGEWSTIRSLIYEGHGG